MYAKVMTIVSTREYNATLSPDFDASEMYQQLDSDNDGKVSVAEFLKAAFSADTDSK